MIKYIALLRGVNVGGKNTVKMASLKASLEKKGFLNVVTYINSGNLIFDSSHPENDLKEICENTIKEEFDIDIPVCVIKAIDFQNMILKAPLWWNKDNCLKHDAIFVIPPVTTNEVVKIIGSIKEEYESLSYYDRVLFWSAPVATFSRTRVSKIVSDKSMYRAITVRNANTALKLCELSKI